MIKCLNLRPGPKVFVIAFSVLISSFSFSSLADDRAKAGPSPAVTSSPGGQNACIQRVNSEVCQKLQGAKGLLKPEQCSSQVSGSAAQVADMLGGCASGVIQAGADMAKFLKDSVMNVASASGSVMSGVYSYLTDGNSRAATHDSLKSAVKSSGDYLQSVYPYIVSNYQRAIDGLPKNMDEAQKAFSAASQVGPGMMKSLLGSAWSIVESQFEEIQCLDNKTRAQMACKLAGQILIPPGAFFALIKGGAKGLGAMSHLKDGLKAALKDGFGTGRDCKSRIAGNARAAVMVCDLAMAAMGIGTGAPVNVEMKDAYKEPARAERVERDSRYRIGGGRKK